MICLLYLSLCEPSLYLDSSTFEVKLSRSEEVQPIRVKESDKLSTHESDKLSTGLNSMDSPRDGYQNV